jgi:serine phosphatase RsbU (regulator of sigma subunit)
MVMAMVKSAVHMGSSDEALPGLLSKLNRVILSLAAPNVFATFACVAGSEGREITFVLAGHLPILHYRKGPGLVEERTVSNLPLGILPDAEFATATIVCEPGDVLAIMTDGLTETFDEHDREVGLGPLKAALLDAAAAPLAEVIDKLRKTSLTWGKQADDQTVLLVRRDS